MPATPATPASRKNRGSDGEEENSGGPSNSQRMRDEDILRSVKLMIQDGGEAMASGSQKVINSYRVSDSVFTMVRSLTVRT